MSTLVALAATAVCTPPEGPVLDTGPVDLVWPNDDSAANSDPWIAEHHARIREMRPRVLALNFVNAKSMGEMHAQLAQAIDAIAEGSRYHAYFDDDAPAFLQYQLAYEIDLRDDAPDGNAPLRNSTKYPREALQLGSWGFSYGELFGAEMAAEYDIRDPETGDGPLALCELIDRGLVHEVWIYGDADVPDVSAAEILERKPFYDADRKRTLAPMNPCAGNGCFDAEDVILCDRTVRVAWFNHTRGAGCFLESLSHGMESIGARQPGLLPTLSRDFIPFAGFDLDERWGLPFDSWYWCPYDRDCLEYPSETSVRYIAGDPAVTVESYDPVCGNAHWPPNGRRQYDLDNAQPVRTSCMRYLDGSDDTDLYSADVLGSFEELAPDCMGPWLIFWRQSMPGLKNSARDAEGRPVLNWWPYLFY